MRRLLPAFPAIFVLLWSTGFIGARYAMPYAEPFTFLTLRYAATLAVLVPIVLIASAPFPAPTPAMHAAIAGILIHGVYQGGVFFAIRHGLDAGITALVVGLQPLVTAFLAAGTLGERFGRREMVGLALGLAGVAMVIVPRIDGSGSMTLFNVLPVFLACLGISAGTVWQKRFVGGVDLRTGTAIQYVGALVPTALLAVATEPLEVEVTGELIFALFWLVFVLSLGAVGLMLFLIREGRVSKVASLMYLVPGATAIEAYLLFGETLTPIQILGLLVSGIGVAAAMRGRRIRRTPLAG